MLLSWLVGFAVAAEPDAEKEREWFPFVLPFAGYTSTDGFGVGAGGAVYSRPIAWDEGYRWRVSGQLWTTLGFAYQSHSVNVDWRGDRNRIVGTMGYRRWDNLLFAGEGGGDVLLHQDEREGDNFAVGPYAFFGLARQFPGSPIAPYLQTYLRSVHVEPHPGGLLDERVPDGVGGGIYGDVTLGAEVLDTDRWPVPNRGTTGELSVSAGISSTHAWGPVDRTRGAVANVHGEITRWQPLIGERLVLASHALFDHSVGPRPFYELEVMGGRWRDELGNDQPLSGYGRTRTRGDGVVTAMIELRPLVFRTNHKFWDIGMYGSFYAEEGFLFDGWDPGPHLPSLGVGTTLLWQKALQMRPFIAWGWRADEPGGARHPVPQFGVSFQDPL